MTDKIRRISLLSLVMISVALPMTGGCSSNPVTGKKEFIAIPRSYEIAMGAQAAPQVATQFGGEVKDSVLQEYVQKVGKKVAVQADREMPYNFTLLNSGIPNAFALPGGNIFVTAGLMSRMTNERQLAAVLGHEVVHVAALHGVKGMQRQVGASVVVQLAAAAVGSDTKAAAEAAAKIAASMITLKYGRNAEYESDKYGTKYMTKAGYNPWGMVELLTILLNLSDKEPGSLQEMFQTHPLSSKRIAEIKEEIEDEDMYEGYSATAPDPNAAQFAAMRKRLMKAATFESGKKTKRPT